MLYCWMWFVFDVKFEFCYLQEEGLGVVWGYVYDFVIFYYFGCSYFNNVVIRDGNYYLQELRVCLINIKCMFDKMRKMLVYWVGVLFGICYVQLK